MRDAERIDKFCDELKRIWKKNPDLRFGQLILNVYHNDKILYYTEDNRLLEKLKEFYK